MNFEQMNNNNKVYIAGVVEFNPVFSHDVMGENFYESVLKVKRLSESYDFVPFTISEKLMSEFNVMKGKIVAFNGQFRSYNKQDTDKNRLMLTVFVKDVLEYDESLNPNIIEINGFVCKEPVYRTTPFKREICDVLIAVNRSYNKSDYLPCIAWGKNANFVKDLMVGDKVSLYGRIQSRKYQKRLDSGEMVEKTAYEISLNKVEKEEVKMVSRPLEYSVMQR